MTRHEKGNNKFLYALRGIWNTFKEMSVEGKIIVVGGIILMIAATVTICYIWSHLYVAEYLYQDGSIIRRLLWH